MESKNEVVVGLQMADTEVDRSLLRWDAVAPGVQFLGEVAQPSVQ